jgi:hypothetical protein
VAAWFQRGAHEVSVGDALRRYHAAAAHTVPADARFEPQPGVYQYRGDGVDRISVLGTTQRWGSEVRGIVTNDGGGCWTFEALFNSLHSQSWRYCVRDGALYEHGGESVQEFDFGTWSAKDHSTFTCSQPGVVLRARERVGASYPLRCEGHSEQNDTDTVSSGTMTLVGRETIDVGGEPLETFHVRSARTVSRDQHGTERSDNWFSVKTGLLVKMTRDIQVSSKTFIGDVRYHEQGTIELLSTTPTR